MSMDLVVKVKPGAKKSEVRKLPDGSYIVAVTAAPEKGKANAAVIKQLADFLDVSPSKLVIVKGETSSKKVVKNLAS